MPTTKCPECDALVTYAVPDAAAWYARKGVPYDTVVVARCPKCVLGYDPADGDDEDDDD